MPTKRVQRIQVAENKSVAISRHKGQLTVVDPSGLLVGRHYSQLRYWGFNNDWDAGEFCLTTQEEVSTLRKLVQYLNGQRIPFSLSSEVAASQAKTQQLQDAVAYAVSAGAKLKAAKLADVTDREFLRFLRTGLSRRLKPHQIKAALHLLAVGNGANFSVPGSGKTSVILAVFHWLRSRKEIDSLFVVGPPSCFAPWKMEYEAVIGVKPTWEILAGGNVNERRAKYYVGRNGVRDLYLTSFQTLLRDWEKVKLLFNQRNTRFALVIDEAHYIKQVGGAWAKAVLNIAKYASVRWVLTGTPFPYSYADAFNAFDVLWPEAPAITDNDKIRIQQHLQDKQHEEAASVLEAKIGPLFYRVRKCDLNLARQDFRPPTILSMNKHERRIYEAILFKIRHLAKAEVSTDLDLMLRLKKGRMIRLRQCISYAKLVQSAVTDYREDLISNKLSLADSIKHYDKIETPAKLEYLVEFASDLRRQGEKLVVWSNFVGTLKKICSVLRESGHGVHLIFGETPTELSSADEELTREKIITDFVDESSLINILVANPAACAESISLHKSCSHALYYDLSYNCAQFIQSTDRIHRVGGSEHKIAHYHFLQYADTIDQDIHSNLMRKSANMSAIIDRDYPIYSLDMFSEDEELEAYDRIFQNGTGRA